MDDVLTCVKPVLQLDACHRKGVWGGTLYYITVTSACQDIFPIAFGMTAENECEDSWRYILEKLKEACPVLSSYTGPCHEEDAAEGEDATEGEDEEETQDNTKKKSVWCNWRP